MPVVSWGNIIRNLLEVNCLFVSEEFIRVNFLDLSLTVPYLPLVLDKFSPDFVKALLRIVEVVNLVEVLLGKLNLVLDKSVLMREIIILIALLVSELDVLKPDVVAPFLDFIFHHVFEIVSVLCFLDKKNLSLSLG